MSHYRDEATKILETVFSQKTIAKITCEYIYFKQNGHDIKLTSVSCAANENLNITDSISGFQYSLRSKSLNYTIYFSVGLDNDPLYTNMIKAEIPECIRLAIECNIINLDSAKALALKKFPFFSIDLDRIYLEKNKSDSKFYWILHLTSVTNNAKQIMLINIDNGKEIGIADFQYAW